MKYNILLLALIFASVIAVDEDCKDHPWSKRDVFGKLKTKMAISSDTNIDLVASTFSSTSTIKADAALSADV